MTKSTSPRGSRKLEPPPMPPEFPLTPHPSGKFQKAVLPNGSRVNKYFGAWTKREGGQLVPVADGGWQQTKEPTKHLGRATVS